MLSMVQDFIEKLASWWDEMDYQTVPKVVNAYPISAYRLCKSRFRGMIPYSSDKQLSKVPDFPLVTTFPLGTALAKTITWSEQGRIWKFELKKYFFGRLCPSGQNAGFAGGDRKWRIPSCYLKVRIALWGICGRTLLGVSAIISLGS